MNEVIQQLFNRKSVRVFTEQEISSECKNIILASATQAPTAGNQQLYTIIDVTSQELKNTLQDLLEQDVDNKYFLSERILPTILSDGTGGYKAKSEIDLKIARPLCATMAKMHRACQDNYVTQNGKVRRLTPRECARLQGFADRWGDIDTKTKLTDEEVEYICKEMKGDLIWKLDIFLICTLVIKTSLIMTTDHSEILNIWKKNSLQDGTPL